MFAIIGALLFWGGILILIGMIFPAWVIRLFILICDIMLTGFATLAGLGLAGIIFLLGVGVDGALTLMFGVAPFEGSFQALAAQFGWPAVILGWFCGWAFVTGFLYVRYLWFRSAKE